ncbi:MAG: hypothetical protein JNJ53_08430, partial [Rhizobiales bacterium]|nr:hypothetical protein [Hyphomicrobiales bacterium]
ACWFIDLQRKDDPARETKLVRLAEITRHPQRTAAFVLKSEATSGDFTNVGGIDIELCHIFEFYPSFRLERR